MQPRHALAKTVSQAVTFSVQNVNRSKLACATDGAAYQMHGHLVGPRSALSSAKKRKRAAATLYLHGLGFGEWFWNFTAVPGLQLRHGAGAGAATSRS